VPLAPAESTAIAERLVRARFDGTALSAFPGRQPNDLDSAYRIQDAAISRWHDRIVGWKVGGIPPEQQESLGADRLVGPVFSRDLRLAVREREVRFPVFEGGFAAVEAEVVFRLGADPPFDRPAVDGADALRWVDAVFAGVETAGSPMEAINRLGSTAVVSDFGNNRGLIVGPRIAGPADLDAPLACTTSIEGVEVGRADLPDGLRRPAEALAFALNLSARRRWPLRRGDYITTGALTGIHDIRAGQLAVVAFDGHERIVCRAARDPAHAGTGTP
jgi:2-keto-4-pentenoate hydratase